MLFNVTPWYRSARTGWLLVGLGVLAWDLACPKGETLSEGFRRAHSHPVGAAVVTASWALLTLHLYSKMPKKADPLHLVTVAREAQRDRHVARAA